MADQPDDMSTGTKNQLLAQILAELGWSQVRLLAEISAYVGRGYISRSTVSEWVNQGRVPRDPLPAVVAHILSIATDKKIAVADVWAGTEPRSLWMPADCGVQKSWSYRSVLSAAGDWVANAESSMNSDRRNFMALSGTALTNPAWSFVEGVESPTAVVPSGKFSDARSIKITPLIVNVLEATIKEIEVLDDIEGGNSNNLRFVHNVFTTIAGHVKANKFTDDQTRKRLLTAWAQLCRIGGFMAFDAGAHGYAQRLFRTGLQVAHSIGDRQIGAHILGHLSQQAVYRGNAKDAVQLAEASMQTAKGTSLAIRALANWEYARAQAAMGNELACHDAMETARNLLNSPTALTTRPSYLYWLNPEMMETNNSHTLLTLAQTSPRSAHRLVDEAEKLLTPHMESSKDFRRDFSRVVLLRCSWLARGYLWCGELEQAVKAGKTLLGLIPSVRSHQALTVLRRFGSELAQYYSAQRTPYVAEFSKELNDSLARNAAGATQNTGRFG